MSMKGTIRVGIGGWTFEPWRSGFYPAGLSQKRELEFASRALTSIEINGTYYSTFKSDTWRKWREETPEGFVFAVKASRFCMNRKVLAGAGESVDRFISQGIVELGEKLGPINWQFAATKKFEPEDFNAFLKLLPKEVGRLPLRHAVEVRHPSFVTPAFFDMVAAHSVVVIYADDESFPKIDQPIAGFTYARLMKSAVDLEEGYSDLEMDGFARQAREWSERADVFVYFISGAKVRNPAAVGTRPCYASWPYLTTSRVRLMGTVLPIHATYTAVAGKWSSWDKWTITQFARIGRRMPRCRGTTMPAFTCSPVRCVSSARLLASSIDEACGRASNGSGAEHGISAILVQDLRRGSTDAPRHMRHCSRSVLQRPWEKVRADEISAARRGGNSGNPGRAPWQSPFRRTGMRRPTWRSSESMDKTSPVTSAEADALGIVSVAVK